MANKMFYVKDLGPRELCMVYGYVQPGNYYLFIRSKTNHNQTEEIGEFPSTKAWEIYNGYENKTKQ